MSTKVQHRRGNNSEINNNVPATGEIWYNTDTKALHVGDGSSKGGKVSLTDESIWGERYIGIFANGFIYNNDTDVARGQDGKYYRYVGNDSYPIVVEADTVPSDFSELYRVTSSNNHTDLVDRNIEGAHNASSIITADNRSVQERLDDLPSEVDAAGTAATLIEEHNSDVGAHPELSAFITSEADRAETAADAAALSGKVYADTTAGLAETVDGDYFSVVSGSADGYLDLYINSGGSAVLQKTYPSANIVSGLEKSLGAHAYLYAGTRVLHIEERVTPTSLCVKFDGIRIELPGTSSYKQFTWQDIKATVNDPSLFITSPEGVTDCLQLADACLVYDLENDVITVTDRRIITDQRPDKYFVLLLSAYGIAYDGYLTTLASRDTQSDLTKLTDRVKGMSAVDNVHLYVNSDEDIIAEENKSTFTMHLKFGLIRLFSPTIGNYKYISWADLKADVNDLTKFETSPSGIEDCLKLSDDSLVYNITTNKIQVVKRRTVNEDYQFVLMTSHYGAKYGGFLADLLAYRSVKKLDEHITRFNNIDFTSTSYDVQKEPTVKTCAHRGFNEGSGYSKWAAPENTLPAFRKAAEYGYWGMETDLRLTSDGHWVLMHDATVDKTTDGTGAVNNLTLNQIKALSAHHNNPDYAGVEVPTFKEYLQLCKHYNVTPYCQTYDNPVGDSLAALMDDINSTIGEEAVVVLSFNANHLRNIRTVSTKMPVELLISPNDENDVNIVIGVAKEIGNCSLGANINLLTDNMVKMIADAGIRLSVWSLTQDMVLDNLNRNIQRITSDHTITPFFDEGYQTTFFKNSLDWSNVTKSAGFTGSTAGGTITIPAGEYIEVNLGSIPTNAVTASFNARCTVGDSFCTLSALNEMARIEINKGEEYRIASVIRSVDPADAVIRITSGTGVLSLRDLKVKVFEV